MSEAKPSQRPKVTPSQRPKAKPRGRSKAAEKLDARARQRLDDPATALEEYRRRRDFAHTTEPTGRSSAQQARESGARPIFVVQKHAASHLHYDLRLEMGGVLKSWAVPKGPSLDPAEKRLAVMVEDHPLEYAAFEGTIPEDEYGGGTVMVWDFGYWQPDAGRQPAAAGVHAEAESEVRTGRGISRPTLEIDPESAVQTGELKFILHGHKLKGSWVLVQMKGRGDKNWLLVKHRDEEARSGHDIEEEAPNSVMTGRSIDQIAAEASRHSDGEK